MTAHFVKFIGSEEYTRASEELTVVQIPPFASKKRAPLTPSHAGLWWYVATAIAHLRKGVQTVPELLSQELQLHRVMTHQWHANCDSF